MTFKQIDNIAATVMLILIAATTIGGVFLPRGEVARYETTSKIDSIGDEPIDEVIIYTADWCGFACDTFITEMKRKYNVARIVEATRENNIGYVPQAHIYTKKRVRTIGYHDLFNDKDEIITIYTPKNIIYIDGRRVFTENYSIDTVFRNKKDRNEFIENETADRINRQFESYSERILNNKN